MKLLTQCFSKCVSIGITCNDFVSLGTKPLVNYVPGPLFIKRMDALPPNIVKSRSRWTEFYNNRFALKFDRHLGSVAAEGACQISERLEKSKPESRGKTSDRLVSGGRWFDSNSTADELPC